MIEGVGFKDKFDVTGYIGGCPFEPSVVYHTGFSTCNITSVETYIKDNQIVQIEPDYNVYTYDLWITDKGRQFFDSIFNIKELEIINFLNKKEIYFL